MEKNRKNSNTVAGLGEGEEEEIFFSNKAVTSTPAVVRKNRKRKRSNSRPTTRNTRSRSKMSSVDNSDDLHEEMDGSELEGEDGCVATAVARLAREMKTMNTNMSMMQNGFQISIAEAVAPLSIKWDANIRRIDAVEKKTVLMTKSRRPLTQKLQS